jgi:hypothetical protein
MTDLPGTPGHVRHPDSAESREAPRVGYHDRRRETPERAGSRQGISTRLVHLL